MVRSKVIQFLLGSALLIPAVIAIADEGTTTLTAKAKCQTAPKGILQKTLEKKLENDLTTQGLTKAKVRVKLKELDKEQPDPKTIDIKELFKDTKYTVTPVECVAAPCDNPPTVTLAPSSSASLGQCSVLYKIESKFSYQAEKIVGEGDNKKTTKSKVSGSSEGQLSVPGTLAPTGKNK